MTAVVEKALSLWDMSGSAYRLIAARENRVFKVETPNGPVVLRLHRQNYRSDQELMSELAWTAAVAQGGLNVPAPIASCTQEYLHVVDAVQVDVLTWVPGATLTQIVPSCASIEKAELFFRLGQDMAKLHAVSDAWPPPPDFRRCAWDRTGLLGSAPLWDRFWENPGLSDDDARFFRAFRDQADSTLARIEDSLDFGLIHADLVSENIMVDDGKLHMVDFDDGGFGFRIFDLVTALNKFSDHADFQMLKASLIKGYAGVRPIDLAAFDLFLALRAATYVGWNITRMDESGGQERNDRFIRTARSLAEEYYTKQV